MDNIILVGGGGHCRSVIDVIEKEGRFKIFGILDKEENVGKKVLGYEIIGTDMDLEYFRKYSEYAFVTVGHIKNVNKRKELFSILKEHGYKLPVIISPLAYVSSHSSVDEGTVIMHFAVVNANVRIGKNCIINTKALIEHDCCIGDHCHISTGAILNGNVKVEDETFIGSNAVCVENTFISRGSFIKAKELVK